MTPFYNRDALRRCDLAKLNSLTKYPSIETYHPLNKDRGGVLEGSSPIQSFEGRTVYLTEKVDGANTRIILFPDTFIIGSREELLYCHGDVIPNPMLGIVEAVREVAESAMKSFRDVGCTVLYGETYGGRVTKEAKNYSTAGAFGFRLFDVLEVSFSALERVTAAYNHEPITTIARVRDNGLHGGWMPTFDVDCLAEAIPGMQSVPLVESFMGDLLPSTVDETYAWLQAKMPETRVRLDDTGKGKSEGLIVRSTDRKLIAKIRFEDYERLMMIRTEAARLAKKVEREWS